MKGSKKVFFASSLLSSIIMLCIFSFVSCSENSVTEPSIQDDNYLKQEIIGTWGLNGYRVTYFPDGCFIDSVSNRPVEGQLWKADEIIKGSYRIDNGIIYVYDIDILYLADNISIPVYEGYTGSEIRIDNNVLSTTPVDIFTPIGETDGISGYWSTKKWLTTYNSKETYKGYLECSYQIDKSSSTYFHQVTFLNDPNIETIIDRDIYDYKYPDLKLIVFDILRTVSVEYKNGLMYWYNYKEKRNFYKE